MKGDSEDDRISWKCADPGGDRNVGRVLSERYAGDDGAAWAAGVDRSRNGSGTAFVETEQSAEYRRRDDFIYGSCADGILKCPDHKNKKLLSVVTKQSGQWI